MLFYMLHGCTNSPSVLSSKDKIIDRFGFLGFYNLTKLEKISSETLWLQGVKQTFYLDPVSWLDIKTKELFHPRLYLPASVLPVRLIIVSSIPAETSFNVTVLITLQQVLIRVLLKFPRCIPIKKAEDLLLQLHFWLFKWVILSLEKM